MKARLTLPGSGRITAAVALTATLAACGGPAGQGGTAGTAATMLPVTACNTQNLVVVRDPHSARSSAGSVYLPIDFINESKTPCTLRGYPRVFGIGVNSQLRTKAAELSGKPALVVLQASYAAHAWVRIRHVSGRKEAGCKLFTGKGLRVFAPHSATHAWIDYPFASCVTASQAALAVLPVQQGLANPTIFP